MNRFFIIILLTFFFSIAFSQKDSALSQTQAEEIYSQALNLSSEGNIDGAIEKLKFVIDNKYNDKYIYYMLLDSYASKLARYQSENTDTNALMKTLGEAKKYAEDAVNLYPTDLKLLYRYADYLRGLGDYQGFYDSLQKIITIDKDDIFANYYLGAYYFLNKDYDKAINYFQDVVGSQKSTQEFEFMAIYRSYYSLGLIYANMQKFQTAAQYLEKAKEIYSKDIDLLKLLALNYSEMLEYNKAIENFKEIPASFWNEEIIDSYAGNLFLNKSSELSNIILEYKDETLFVKAIYYYQMKDYTNSLKSLDDFILKRQSADLYSHYLLYLNYFALNDTQKAVQQAFVIGNRAKEIEKFDMAIEFYKKVEAYTNSIPDIYWMIGSLYDEKNSYTNAIYYYEKYNKYPAGKEYKISTLVRLSYMYYKIGDKTNSESYIKESKSSAVSKEDLYQVYFYSGLMNLDLKNITNAIADFEEALKSEKRDSRLYYFLATANYGLNNITRAVNLLEDARLYEANSPEINNLLAYLYALEDTNLDEALKLVNLSPSFEC